MRLEKSKYGSDDVQPFDVKERERPVRMLAKVTDNLYLKRREMLGGPIYKKVT